MVTRLVQSFKNFRLVMEDHPESLPPPEWKASGIGRKAVEKANLKSHLTIYARVRRVTVLNSQDSKNQVLNPIYLRTGCGLRWMRPEFNRSSPPSRNTTVFSTVRDIVPGSDYRVFR